jgi:hypothetical protein
MVMIISPRELAVKITAPGPELKSKGKNMASIFTLS